MRALLEPVDFSGLGVRRAYTGHRFAQLRRGLAHLGDALIVVGLQQVEVAAAERAILFVYANKLAAAAAKPQQRRDAARFSHG